MSSRGLLTQAMAAVAVLAVFGTATFSAVVAVAGDPEPQRDPSGSGDPLNPTQTGAAVPGEAFPRSQVGTFPKQDIRFEVPELDNGWASPGASIIYWDLADGRAILREQAPYGAGFCRDSGLLGFAGPLDPVSDDGQSLEEAGLDSMRPWANAIGSSQDAVEKDPPVIDPPAEGPEPETDQESITLSDGTDAVLTVMTIDVPDTGSRCSPERSELAGVTLDVGDDLVTVVVNRDLDYAPHVRPAERRERPLIDVQTRDTILSSVRPLQ